MTWGGFAGIFALFFLTHSVPVRPAIKARITARIGRRGFAVGYSILSLAMLSLLIWSAREAPYVQLWPQLPWQRQVVHVGMLAACLILAFSIARPNPFSFGGAQNDRFDPAHPGIIRWTRHPILLTLALWAGLHLLPNGDLAHVLLFGILGSFAIAGRTLINRRKQATMGPARWNAINDAVQSAPLVQWPLSVSGAVFRLAVGGLIFAILLVLHPVVIGVSVM